MWSERTFEVGVLPGLITKITSDLRLVFSSTSTTRFINILFILGSRFPWNAVTNY